MRNDEAVCLVEHAISEGRNLQDIAEKLTNECGSRSEKSQLPPDDTAVVIIQFKHGKKKCFWTSHVSCHYQSYIEQALGLAET